MQCILTAAAKRRAVAATSHKIASTITAASSIRHAPAFLPHYRPYPCRCFSSLYMWGTSKKGTIPTNEVLKEGRGEGVGSVGGAGAALLKSAGAGGGGGGGGGGIMYDTPVEIDVRNAFGIDGVKQIKHLECGPTGTAVVLTDNRCFTFGGNECGQLGHGHKKDVVVPTLLSPPLESSPLSQTGVSTIRLGNTFSAIIDTNGDLYTFGYGGSAFSGMGCLGHGDGESYTRPKLVQSLVEDGCFAAEVAVGESHMTVLTTEGEVLTAGAGSYGRLGNLETIDQLYLEPVELICGENVIHITGGFAFTLALTKEGIIHGWGRNDKGQLGTGLGLAVDMYAMEALPRPIESQLEGRRVVKVSAGHSHAACITDHGELFMWGSSVYLEPQLMNTLLHTRIVDVVCGQNYTIALAEDGKMYSFGKGKTGVLGLASVKRSSQPALVEGLADKKAKFVSAGWTHVACFVEDKEVEDAIDEKEQ